MAITEEDLLEAGFYDMQRRLEELAERVDALEQLLQELMSRVKALEG